MDVRTSEGQLYHSVGRQAEVLHTDDSGHGQLRSQPI